MEKIKIKQLVANALHELGKVQEEYFNQKGNWEEDESSKKIMEAKELLVRFVMSQMTQEEIGQGEAGMPS